MEDKRKEEGLVPAAEQSVRADSEMIIEIDDRVAFSAWTIDSEDINADWICKNNTGSCQVTNSSQCSCPAHN